MLNFFLPYLSFFKLYHDIKKSFQKFFYQPLFLSHTEYLQLQSGQKNIYRFH